MNSLALQVQEALHRAVIHMLVIAYVFRGKRGDLLKIPGMTVSGCRCMPCALELAAGSSGHRRPTVSFRSSGCTAWLHARSPMLMPLLVSLTDSGRFMQLLAWSRRLRMALRTAGESWKR